MNIEPMNRSEENVLKRLRLSNHIGARIGGPILIGCSIMELATAYLIGDQFGQWEEGRTFLGLMLLLMGGWLTFVMRERRIIFNLLQRIDKSEAEKAGDSQPPTGGYRDGQQNMDDQSHSARGRAMLVLLALLLAIPWAYHMLRLNAALERIRYAEHWGGLIPAHALVLMWTAYLSGDCAVILVGLVALSWKYPVLVSGRVLGRLATAACAFVVLYAR